MTRANLIECVAEKGHLARSRAELVLDTVFDCLKQSIRRGEKIEIRGFGTFQIRSYRAYKGRNPRLLQPDRIAVPARRPEYPEPRSEGVADPVSGREVAAGAGGQRIALEPAAARRGEVAVPTTD